MPKPRLNFELPEELNKRLKDFIIKHYGLEWRAKAKIGRQALDLWLSLHEKLPGLLEEASIDEVVDVVVKHFKTS